MSAIDPDDGVEMLALLPVDADPAKLFRQFIIVGEKRAAVAIAAEGL